MIVTTILGIDLILRRHTAFGALPLLFSCRDWSEGIALGSQSGPYSFAGSVLSCLLLSIVCFPYRSGFQRLSLIPG